MRSGGGKAKGAAFERLICKQLSLWITYGEREDVFWRTAMSGGRATVAHRKGIKVQQCGDVCAVRPEGYKLTDYYYLECKHLKKISLDSLVKGNGPLLKIWRTTKREAKKYDRYPILIFRQNGWPTLMCTSCGLHLTDVDPTVISGKHDVNLFVLDEVLARRPCIEGDI